MQGKLFIWDDRQQVERHVELDEAELEWIMNSLAGWRDHMLQQAQEAADDGQPQDHNLGDGVPIEERFLSSHALLRDGYEDLVNLRAKLVDVMGRDLTDS